MGQIFSVEFEIILFNRVIVLEKSVTSLSCNNNRLLTNLVGCPDSVTYLDCHSDTLTNLLGCSNSVQEIDYSDNPLHELYNNCTVDQIRYTNDFYIEAVFKKDLPPPKQKTASKRRRRT